MELVRGRWVQWFRFLLITKQAMLDEDIADEFKVCPSCIPLDDLPSILEVIDSIKTIYQTEGLLDPTSLPVDCSNSP